MRPMVMYGAEIWLDIKKEEEIIATFTRKLMRKILEPKGNNDNE